MARFFSLVALALFFFSPQAAAAPHYQHFYITGPDNEIYDIWIPPGRDTWRLVIDDGRMHAICTFTVRPNGLDAVMACRQIARTDSNGLMTRSAGSADFASRSITALSDCETSPRIVFWQHQNPARELPRFQTYMRRYENPTRCGG